MTTTAAMRRPIGGPRRIAGSALQLAALGLVGPLALGAVTATLGAAVGLIPALGVGLLLLAGLVYVLFALAWLESGRVEGLYRFGVRPPRLRRRTRPGVGGVLAALGGQAVDGAMWRGVASLAVASLLGGLLLGVVQIGASGLLLAVDVLRGAAVGAALPDGVVGIRPEWAMPVGIAAAALALAAVVGLALLHGVIARALLAPSRRAQLVEEARTRAAERDGAVRAAEVERTRIERDLHDGVQPRLVSIGMALGLAQRRLDDDPERARDLIAEAHESTRAAITELRQLARGIHPSVLDDRGLDAAISALATRSHLPVSLDVRLEGRCGRTAEAATYFAVAEALTNATKHGGAVQARVQVRRRGDALWARIEDDGAGGARLVPGGGLDGIHNRVLAAGGSMRVDSPEGGPTSVEVTVPCAS